MRRRGAAPGGGLASCSSARAPNVRSRRDGHGVVDPLAEVVEALVVEVVVAGGAVVVVVAGGAGVTLGVAMATFSDT